MMRPSLPSTILLALCFLQSRSGVQSQPVCGDATCQNTEFCGIDTLCHAATCQDYFVYGPTNLTGYRSDRPVELECTPLSDMENQDLHAVVRGCAAVQPGTALPSSSVGLSFNVRCTAVPSYGITFDCYSLEDSADGSTFDNFVDQASLLEESVAGCSPLSYLYQTSTVALIYGEGVLDTQGLASASFKRNFALATFYSVLSYDVIPTASPFPTMSPTTLEPTAAPVVPTAPTTPEDTNEPQAEDTSSSTTMATTTRRSILLLLLSFLFF